MSQGEDQSDPLLNEHHTSDEPYCDFPSHPSSLEPQNQAQLLQDQRRVFEEQDSQLDTLSLSIGRQRDLSLSMNEELELQNELLNDLDADVEHAGLKLGRASGQLETMRRKFKDHGELADRGLCRTPLMG